MALVLYEESSLFEGQSPKLKATAGRRHTKYAMMRIDMVVDIDLSLFM